MHLLNIHHKRAFQQPQSFRILVHVFQFRRVFQFSNSGEIKWFRQFLCDSLHNLLNWLNSPPFSRWRHCKNQVQRWIPLPDRLYCRFDDRWQGCEVALDLLTIDQLSQLAPLSDKLRAPVSVRSSSNTTDRVFSLQDITLRPWPAKSSRVDHNWHDESCLRGC